MSQCRRENQNIVSWKRAEANRPVLVFFVAVTAVALSLLLLPMMARADDGGTAINDGVKSAESNAGNAKSGQITLARMSSLPSISEDVDLYSIGGATYGVYASEEDAAADANMLTTIKVDKDGLGKSKRLPAGTYYVKETKASDGFASDGSIRKVSVGTEDTTILFRVQPISISSESVARRVGGLDDGAAQGKATHEGAKYAIMYYEGYYDWETDYPDCPTRAWIVEADEFGEIALDSEHLVIGCELYSTDEYGVEGTESNLTKACALPLGTVVVEEVESSEGFIKASDAGSSNVKHVITVMESDDKSAAKVLVDGAEAALPVLFNAKEARGDIEFEIADGDFKEARAQAGGSLTEAQFAVINASSAPVFSPQFIVDGKPATVLPGDTVCVVVADSSGHVTTDNASVNGWAIPEGWSGALAYGNYEIAVKEPPAGYAQPSEALAGASIEKDGSCSDMGTVYLNIARGSVKVRVVDADTGLSTPSGEASLEGVKFAIVSNTDGKIVYKGGVYSRGEVVDIIQVKYAKSEGYVASTAEKALPFGKYRLVQIAAGEGYLPGDGIAAFSDEFSIDYDGEIVDYASGDNAVKNQVARADASFTIIDAAGAPIQNAVVKVTANATGEQHMIVADERGYVDTSAAFASRNEVNTLENDQTRKEGSDISRSKSKSNKSDQADADESVSKSSESNTASEDNSKADETGGEASPSVSAAGIWFYGNAECEGGVSTSKGALPYGVYTIEQIGEKAVSAKFQLEVCENGRDADLGIVGAEYQAPTNITASLKEGNDDGEQSASKRRFVETVQIKNVEEGKQYRLVSELHERNAQGNDAGVLMTKEDSALKPTSSSAEHEVVFELEKDEVDGKPLFVTCSLYKGSELVAKSDANATDACVCAPKAQASLTVKDVLEGSLVERVEITGLKPNEAYVVRTSIEAQDEDGYESVVSDAQGDVVKREAIITATQDGMGTFEREVTGAYGFEHSGKLQTQAQVSEAGPMGIEVESATSSTVTLPNIETEFHAEGGMKAAPVGEDVKLSDEVEISGLEKGCEYRVAGEVHLIDEGGQDRGSILGATDEKTVKATSAKVETELEFAIDTEYYKGCSLRCVVKLTGPGNFEITHEDEDSETVSVPDFATYAVDSSTETHTGRAWHDGGIDCDFAYEGLVPGSEYEITVFANEFDENGSVGDAIIPSGAPQKFTPKENDGNERFTVSIDTTRLGGKKIYASYVLTCEGVEIARYDKPSDELQQISYAKIETWARDKANGTHTLAASEKASATDTVYYSGLVPGERYVLAATMMVIDSNGKALGEYSPSAGNPAGGTVSFTPTTPEGRVDVPITVDASDLGGVRFSIYEELQVEGKCAAEHKEASDEDQRLNVARIKTVATDSKTGKHEGSVADEVCVNDVVTYENLTPGVTYYLTGKLIDFAKKEALKDSSGNEIAGTAEFKAEKSSGEVTVQFKIQGSGLDGKTVIAYEKLTDSDGNEIASHELLESYDQSVTYHSGDVNGSGMPVTGDLLKWWWVALVVVTVGAGAAAVIAWRHRR